MDKPLADMHRRTLAAALWVAAHDAALGCQAHAAEYRKTARTNLELLSAANGYRPTLGPVVVAGWP